MGIGHSPEADALLLLFDVHRVVLFGPCLLSASSLSSLFFTVGLCGGFFSVAVAWVGGVRCTVRAVLELDSIYSALRCRTNRFKLLSICLMPPRRGAEQSRPLLMLSIPCFGQGLQGFAEL